MGSAESTMAVGAPDLLAGSLQQGLGRIVATATGVFGWSPALTLACAMAVIAFMCLDLQEVALGDPVQLFFHPDSPLAQKVLSKLTFGRFWPCPWLLSAHLQTMFLHFFTSAPDVGYRRKLYITPDGGTIALDWAEPVEEQGAESARDGTTPIVVVVPGLTSDSKSGYILHAVEAVKRRGWRALVVNHRGLGGIALTSDTFYNAGWTEDLKGVILHIRKSEPSTSLLALGCSLGANILTKYLGEERGDSPLAAAATVGCPWDLLVCDRAIHRTFRQRLYGRAMHHGLRDFADMHKDCFQRLIDWDHAAKATTVRQFDDRITRLIGKFETVDTYYRKTSCAQFLPTVSVPLFAISSLDDPICTPEAIPYDEFRANPNLLLGVTKHGGHLAYLTGMRAEKIWWTDVVLDYMGVVLDLPTSLSRVEPTSDGGQVPQAELEIDQAPAVAVCPPSNTMAPLPPGAIEPEVGQPAGGLLNATDTAGKPNCEVSSGGQEVEQVDAAPPSRASCSREPPSEDGELAGDGKDLQAVEVLATSGEEASAGSAIKDGGPLVKFRSQAELSGLERALALLQTRMRACRGDTDGGALGAPPPEVGCSPPSTSKADGAAVHPTMEASIAASASAISAAAASIAQSAATIVTLLQAAKQLEPVQDYSHPHSLTGQSPMKGGRRRRVELMRSQSGGYEALPSPTGTPGRLSFSYLYLATILAAATGVPLVATAFLFSHRRKLLQS